jgi:two-component system, OmpR family, response regulator
MITGADCMPPETHTRRRRAQHQRGQRVLVVDDDDYIRELVASALRFAGFAVDVCDDGSSTLEHVETFAPDLILLDIMMPKVDGIEACRRLRAARIETPVIFLTARGRTDEKILGLVEGGDDYVTKPFDLDELVARIDAVLKRTSSSAVSPGRHEYDGIVLDDDAHRAWLDEQLIPLSPTEFRLLRYLLINAERVVSRTQILNSVWGYDYAGDPGAVETYVFYLRKKLGAAGTRLIHTVRGVGYSLRAE